MSLRLGNPATICVVLLLLAYLPAARCQQIPDPMLDGLHNRARQFLEKVSQDQSDAAYEELLRDSPLMKQFQQSEKLKNLVEKTAELQAKYGEFRKIERIASRRIGENLVVLRYLFECEYFPVVWHFAFYRTPPRDSLAAPLELPWRMVLVRFDTELEKLAQGGTE